MKATNLLLAVAVAVAFASPSASAGESAKIRVDFTKCNPVAEPGYLFSLTGPATGDVQGSLTAKVAVYIPGATHTYIEADYFVTASSPQDSFVASVAGRVTNATNLAVLYGYVNETNEKWRGAQVRDDFLNFTNAAGVPCSMGTLVLTPRWNPAHDAGGGQ